MPDNEWYLTLKAAFKEPTDSDKRVIELIWNYPGIPVFHLPEKLNREPGGMVWLTIGNRIAKKRLWNRVPKRIRSQNERPGYLPFYSGVLALQLPFMQFSESMGDHDSKIVDAASVD